MRKVRRMACLILCFLLVFQAGTTAWGTELTENVPGAVTQEATEATEQAEPTEEAEPTETTEATEQAEPTETTEPTEEPETAEQAEPTEEAEPTEQAEEPEPTELTEEPVSTFGMARAATHITPLTNTLAEGFADASKWTIVGSTSAAVISDGKFTVSGSGMCNAAVYNEKIEADKFLISMDVTLKGAITDAEDIKVAFRCADSGLTGDDLYVRIKLQNAGIIRLEKCKNIVTDANNFTAIGNLSSSWSWTQNETYGLDLLVDGNTVTLYIDGTQIGTYTDAQIGAMGRGYFAVAGQWANQNWEISNLKITSDESGQPEQNPATHISALDRELVENMLSDASKWQCTANNVTIANGTATIKNAGADNRMAFKEILSADKFLISMDVTPNQETTAAADLKVSFNGADTAAGDRVQVRLKFKDDSDKGVYIERSATDDSTANRYTWRQKSQTPFTWTTGTAFGLDILADRSQNTVTVYVNGAEVAKHTHADIGGMAQGYFGIAGQYPGQNFTISNLKITTDEKPAIKHALEPLGRVLAEDDFSSGSKWKSQTANANSSVVFEENMAKIKGGGKCNAISLVDLVSAKNFRIRMDMTLNDGHTNASVKAAFKMENPLYNSTGERLEIRLDTTNGLVVIQKATSNNSDNNSDSPPTKLVQENYTFKLGETYAVDIDVADNTIKVYINGGQTPVVTATDTKIGAMQKGYFAIAGEYPAQDFGISNLDITTDEVQTGPEYTVTLVSATDGKMNDETGGTLTADVLKGYEGDRVKLTPSPKHGYVFDRYESFKEDGTGTDGHLPIADNSFAFNSKTGNVTVVAHFKTRVPGRFELFYDDFGAASLDPAYKTVGEAAGAVQKDGVLTLDAKNDGANYLLLNGDIFNALKDGEGYRISADIWKADANAGTMQIAFRGADDSPNGRYALVLNGNKALFKSALAGSDETSVELASKLFTFNTNKMHVELEVEGNTVTFFADGKEILSYTSQDGWPIGHVVGLYNMTYGSKVCFDNLLVERMPEKTALGVKVLLRENGADTEDTERTSGIAELSAYSAVEGDEITVTASAKAGYRLAECYIEENRQIAVTDGKFTVPSGQTGTLTVAVVFEASEPSGARSYYIDSEGGDDANPGTMERPWKSFAPLAGENVVLEPGCGIYLKRGSTFTGQQLAFRGMGSADAPVTVDAYGEGELPRIDGAGAVENVVSLYNQQYITIQNLEITNTAPEFKSVFTLNGNNNTSKNLRAINVSAKDFGVVSGIYIKNCYIHDVNGNNGVKWNGGIFFDVQATVTNMQLSGVPTKYDDVLIEGCTIRNVDRSGIKLVSSAWCNQWLGNDGGKPVNWYPSTNVVIRGNYLEKIGGDGITTRDTDGTLIEHNLARDCRYQNTGYNVAIWPFQAANTVIQYNEAYDTHSVQDGQGLDCDHASSYSLMQYNYSHNNEGGFMLIMGGYPHTAATVRYNVSQNDRDKAFEFAQGLPMGTMIYNNTIYSENPVGKGLFYLSNTSRNQNKGRGVKDFYVFNNLFCYPSSQTTYYGGETANIKAVINLYNNGWVGGIQPPSEEVNPVVAADTASVLVSAGSAPETNDTGVARTGSAEELAGYQLAEGAPVIDKGVTLEQAIAYFATGDPDGSYDIFDGRSLSPSKLEEQYQGGWGTTISVDMDSQNREDSIKYVMGTNFPRVGGVRYDLDFFGNKNTEGSAPDIGAAEYLQHTHSGGTATCKKRAVCEICGVEYGKTDPDGHSFVDYKSDGNATCTEDGTKTAACAYGCGATDTKADAGSAKGHQGREATCHTKAVCETCGQEYGSLNPANHAGGTELRNEKEATVTEEGYTGDICCKGCGAVLSAGRKTDRLPQPDDTEEPNEPGTDEPGTDEPGTDEPGTEEPGTNEPGTDEPGTNEPGTNQPDTNPSNPNPSNPDVWNPSDSGNQGTQTSDSGGNASGSQRTPARRPQQNNVPGSVSQQAAQGNPPLRASAGETLPAGMELRTTEVSEENQDVLKKSVEGQHKDAFKNMQVVYVNVDLIRVNGGKETAVHDQEVTYILSLPGDVTRETRQDYHYAILHLKEDGSIEQIEPEVTEKGLVVTSTLSPFAVGYGKHEEGDGVITLEPTGTADGAMTYFCTVCGAEIRTETLAKLAPAAPEQGGGEDVPAGEEKQEGGVSPVVWILLLLAVALIAAYFLLQARRNSGKPKGK